MTLPMSECPPYNQLFNDAAAFGMVGTMMDVHHQVNTGHVLEDIHPWAQAGADYYHYYGDNIFYYGTIYAAGMLDNPNNMNLMMRLAGESFNDTVVGNFNANPTYALPDYAGISVFTYNPSNVQGTVQVTFDEDTDEMTTTVFLLEHIQSI